MVNLSLNEGLLSACNVFSHYKICDHFIIPMVGLFQQTKKKEAFFQKRYKVFCIFMKENVLKYLVEKLLLAIKEFRYVL